MRLNQVKSKLRTLLNLEEIPDIIVLHCGGNDIGLSSIGDLRSFVKAQLRYINRILPNTKLVWSEILPRQNWRYSENNDAMERARKRLNSCASTEAIRLGGSCIKYPDINLNNGSLSRDGVHLSSTGNDIFLNTIQNALENIKAKGKR